MQLAASSCILLTSGNPWVRSAYGYSCAVHGPKELPEASRASKWHDQAGWMKMCLMGKVAAAQTRCTM